ncbi:MAG TPA: AsmA-like C-terminal region-containing protein [Chthoniobacterales bacterium]|nr:AsmA-like C-terminal region-containing protein [Chthoniobacterales bacterium]
MPAVLETPPEVTRRRPQDRQPSLARRFVRSAVRLAVVLALSAFITGGWYLSKKGFGREWRSRIAEELHKHGVEAHIRRLTLDPFRGLIAKDVRIFDYKRRENTLARISEIALDINYAALLHHQPFLNALDIRNAQITLPIKTSDTGSAQAQLTNFRAHIYFPPEQIYVSQAEGIFCGLRISATGQLIKRTSYQPSSALTEEEWRMRLSMLQRVAIELQKFNFPRARPSLQVKFSGDLEQLEDAHLEATLQGEELRRGAYTISELFASAEWTDQVFNISRCQWRDIVGTFAAKASWGRRTNEANFQIRSDLALKDFLDAFGLGQPLRDAAFTAPPALELSGVASFGGERPQIKVIGRASVGAFSYKGVPFADLRGQFSWDGERTLLRDVRLRHQTGDLSAQLFDAPNDFRLKIDSHLSPAILRPLVSPELSQFLSEWEWPRPPDVHLVIHSQDRQPENWKGEGTIALERARFRGAWMNSATANVRFGDGAILYDNLRVTRDEGIGTGSFAYDFKNHEVRINKIKTSLRPAEAILWVDPKLWKTVVPYKFRRPPNVTTNGVYQFRGGKNTHIDIGVEAPGGMDYGFLGKTLPFDRVVSRLLFTNDRLQIVDLKAGLFSGSVHGTADISLAKNDPHYHAKIAVAEINFPQLTDLYYNYKTAQGALSGTYDFTGLGTAARAMQGSGTLEVTNGDVFAIPVFGPLSAILNSIIPGAGYSIAHRADARFTIKDGIIHTDDFDATGRLFRLLGHGDIHFLDDKLDFYLRIGGKGPSILLTPVYKLFEYVGEGSLKHPDWHPKRF